MNLVFKALNLAAKAPRGQTRKKDVDPEVLYIVHPAAVAIILSQHGTDQVTVAAGILHDVVEDTQIGIDDIENGFGKEVAKIVSDVTEFDKKLPWRERKEQAIKHIKNMGENSLLVKTADKIHNLSSLLESYKHHGTAAFEVFKAPPQEMLEMDKKLYKSLEEKRSENPLLPWLKKLVAKLESLQP